MSDDPVYPLTKVISGGQSGADMVALEAAFGASLETGGMVPAGYAKTSPQRLYADRYGLVEMNKTFFYRDALIDRSCRNVDISDGTLAIFLTSTPGTRCTINYCKAHVWSGSSSRCPYQKYQPGVDYKPHFVVTALTRQNVERARRFITKYNIKTLNVCGSRNLRDLVDKTSHFREMEMNLLTFLTLVFRSTPDDDDKG